MGLFRKIVGATGFEPYSITGIPGDCSGESHLCAETARKGNLSNGSFAAGSDAAAATGGKFFWSSPVLPPKKSGSPMKTGLNQNSLTDGSNTPREG